MAFIVRCFSFPSWLCHLVHTHRAYTLPRELFKKKEDHHIPAALTPEIEAFFCLVLQVLTPQSQAVKSQPSPQVDSEDRPFLSHVWDTMEGFQKVPIAYLRLLLFCGDEPNAFHTSHGFSASRAHLLLPISSCPVVVAQARRWHPRPLSSLPRPGTPKSHLCTYPPLCPKQQSAASSYLNLSPLALVSPRRLS